MIVAAVAGRGATRTGISGVSGAGYSCGLALLKQCPPQRTVKFLVNRRCRFMKPRVSCRNHNGIGEVLAVENDSTTGPTSDEIALARISGDVGEPAEISKRQGRGTPAIKSNRRRLRGFEQRFIDRHIDGGRSRIDVVKND